MPVYRQEAPPRRPSPLPRPSMGDNHPKAPLASAAVAQCSNAGVKIQSFAPPALPFHPSRAAPNPQLKPLELPAVQARFIAETMGGLRSRAAKRRRVDASRQTVEPASSHIEHDGGGSSADEEGGSVASAAGFDILEALDAHPDVVHIVATAGGLITHWNESFAGIAKPAPALRRAPLSLFDLVESTALPSLYQIFALALHNVAVADVEDFRHTSSAQDDESGEEASRSPSHLSITLPCRTFRTSPVEYDITVVFMSDDVPARRCFLGILAPRKTESDRRSGDGAGLLPMGKIVRASDDVLCRTLLGSESNV
ncbi:hypothetical protein ACHAXT_003753 [Thalassiosira profunda]